MTLFDYLIAHIDDFEEKIIMEATGEKIYEGTLQDIPFDVPIHEMTVLCMKENTITVSR